MKPLLFASLWMALLGAVSPPALADTGPVSSASAIGNSADKDKALQARLDFAEQHYRYPERIKDTLINPQWLRDSDRFVYWSATGSHPDTWVMVDARTGADEPLIDVADLHAQLNRIAGKQIAAPSNPLYAISPDQQQIVFRHLNRTYALTLSNRRIMALAPTDPLALALSPDSVASSDRKAFAIQRETGFAVVNANGHALVERTGQENHEWQIPPKAWSPDSRVLMAWRNDSRAVHKIPIVDYSSAIEKVAMVPYAKSGTPLVRQELYAVDPATGRVARMSMPDGETYNWLAGWRPDGSEALLLQLSRDGKRLDLSAVDPRSGKTRLVLHEERPQSFVGALDFATEGWAMQVTPLDDNRHFLWISERDGWRHVYLYDYSGKLIRQVTHGDFPVHRVMGLTPDKQAVLVVASADKSAPYDRLLYRAALDGSAMERLTPDPGIHRIIPSPSMRYYIDGHATRTQPRVWDVNAVDDKTSFRYAKADASALAKIHYAPPEGITVLAADGVTPLYGVLYKPWNFDPRKRYPVIDCIYAGPFIAVVPWSYAGSGEASPNAAAALAQLGYITLVLDARGTPGRGKAFQDVNYGRVGQTEIPDHVAALRQAAASRPYMDMDKVGIYGASWGGYFVLRGMLTAPDFFKAGYAAAPGAPDEDALVNEPNLGLPGVNPEAYKAGSNELIADRLRGALRIMHGTSDIDAPLSTTMRMADALIRADKRFELLIMPGQPHNAVGPARRYANDDARMFFLRTLPPPEAGPDISSSSDAVTVLERDGGMLTR
ncbi:dipeptidyl aminopeptidase/acylaminoacyl peptidase [Luteibacter rhizovicinus]|uniref:Dipeptidyl aminopeptidase/acylaminoacyl peptidase n=1 Tax=Luteibacter rhizovicinus TaxID=242606 RepID=A0A4R3YY65_9GAMM|nr:DPP IV N-terminal domain-containing protein [Luteibacter rhizovicinus]TCV96424.1 dipeptidyl aminopeptidase/acylaminoacyl peptidase [Luteibacter rhizovicinus]